MATEGNGDENEVAEQQVVDRAGDGVIYKAKFELRLDYAVVEHSLDDTVVFQQKDRCDRVKMFFRVMGQEEC